MTLIWKENILKMIFLPNLKGTREIKRNHKLSVHKIFVNQNPHGTQGWSTLFIIPLSARLSSLPSANSLLCNQILHVIDYA